MRIEEAIRMDIKIGAIEYEFAKIIWANEPIASGALAKICDKELNWRRTTTYSILKKLCRKGLFQNVNGIVTSLVLPEQFRAEKSRCFVEENFGGSLPAFVAAFSSGETLSQEDVEELEKIIEAYRKKNLLP